MWLRRRQMWAGVDTGCFVPPPEQVVKGGMVTGRCGGTAALMRVDRVSPWSVVVPAARCHILWRSVGAAEQRCLWNIVNYIQGIILLLRHYGRFALKRLYYSHFHIFIIPSPHIKKNSAPKKTNRLLLLCFKSIKNGHTRDTSMPIPYSCYWACETFLIWLCAFILKSSATN